MTRNDVVASSGTFPIVGIGIVDGSVGALEQFFAALPGDSGVAFIVVHDSPSERKTNLIETLRRHTNVPVQHVEDRAQVEPDHVYIAASDTILTLDGYTLLAAKRTADTAQSAAIDHFFRSLAHAHGDRAIGIVLSGSGTDGTMGLKTIREHAGLTMIQTPVDAEHGHVQDNAVRGNIVDVVGAARELAEHVLSYVRSTPEIDFRADKLVSERDENDLQKLLTYLYTKTEHDFTHYKRSTILRRLERRMRMHHLPTIAQYLDYLRGHPEETRALLKDVLISVTGFFRDPDAFAALEQQVIPHLFTDRDREQPVRVWVAGCATGEEAYSVAMLLWECAVDLECAPEFQIFATDVDEDAIAEARARVYHDTIENTVSPERLERFFEKVAGGYRVREELRDRILFAPHNLIEDPPFSKLALISCRNVLIYLNRTVQEKILNLLHYALRPNGYLFLGPSESTERVANLFTPVDKAHGVVQRRDVATPNQVPNLPFARSRTPHVPAADRPSRSLEELYDAWTLKRYAPPRLLVNEQYEIVHVFGGAGRYLQDTDGPVSLNVLQKIHPALRLDLRVALRHAFQQGKRTTSEAIPIKLHEQTRRVQLHVGPVEEPGFPPGYAEIVFEEREVPSPEARTVDVPTDRAEQPEVEHLEAELQRTRERLAAVTEEYENASEQLKTSNEELLSMNEELYTTTEELETSKEELQVTNEELSAVNYELEAKVEELNRLASDLQNLMASTDIGILFLDRDLNVERFTPPLEDIFDVAASDIGRPVAQLSHVFAYNRFAEDARTVLKTLTTLERELYSRTDRCYLVRMFPYRTVDDKIDGVVVTFIDMTELKRAERTVRHRAQQQAVVAELGQLALEGADLDLLMNETVQRVANTLDVTYCKILELLPDGEELLLKAGVGWKQGYVGNATVGTELDSQAGYTLSVEGPVIVEDLRTESRFHGPALLIDHDVVSGISVVIHGPEGYYGVLGTHTKQHRRFSQDDVNFVQAIANVLAAAIARRHVEQALEEANATLEARVAERTQELAAANERLREEVEQRKRAQERFSKAFHANPAACVIQELPDLRYVDVNASFERLTGYSRDELLGRTSEELNLLLDVEKRGTAVQYLLEDRTTPLDEYRIRDKSGKVRYVLAAGEPIEVDGTPCVLGMIVDITEIQRAEQRFATVFQLAPVAATISRLEDGRFIDVNERYTEVTGYAREEVVGRTSIELGLVEPERREQLAGRIQNEGGYRNLEATLYTKSGERRHISAVTSLIELDGEPAILGFFHDVTEQKQLEAELEAHRDQLQKLVDERTAELAAKTEALEREVVERKRTAAQLKQLNEVLEERVAERTRKVRTLASELTLAEQRERHRIAQILHDHVQQLLHGLRTQMALLRHVDRERQTAVVARMDDIAKEAIRATRNLVVDLSPPVLEGEHLPGAIRWLGGQMNELHDLTITIDVEGEPRAPSEEMRILLFQIVRELLFNVVKHADVDDARVQVTEHPERLTIVVEDRGRGFDVTTLSDSNTPQTGFGLRRIRERLSLFDGRLAIDSDSETGTRVTIEVPLPSPRDDALGQHSAE